MRIVILGGTEQLIEQCLNCAHSYKRKDDDDTLYCRCRKDCNYKERATAVSDMRGEE